MTEHETVNLRGFRGGSFEHVAASVHGMRDRGEPVSTELEER